MANKNFLLLTSTIAPATNAPGLAHTDPNRRLADYSTALEFYLASLRNGTVDHIVYTDNSGYPLEQLVTQVENQRLSNLVTFISYTSKLSPTLPRYYLEMNLIDHALRHAPIFLEPEAATIWKITGRYVIHNLSTIVTGQPNEFDLYVNCRDYPAPWTDVFIVGFRKASFHKTLFLNIENYTSTRVSGERLLREQIKMGAFENQIIVPRFRTTPRTAGIRGVDGRRYDNLPNTFRFYVRAIANRLFPSLWI